jgi:hypothetical protein
MLLLLLRKAGIFFIAATACWYLLQKDYWKFFTFSVILGTVMVGWELVCVYFTETSTSFNTFTYLTTLTRWDFADVLTAWVLPPIIPISIRIVVVLLFATSIVFNYKPYVLQLWQKPATKPLIVVVVIYLLFLILFIGSPDRSEAQRFISIILPVCNLLLFSFVNAIYSAPDLSRKLFYTTLTVWMVYPVVQTLSNLL